MAVKEIEFLAIEKYQSGMTVASVIAAGLLWLAALALNGYFTVIVLGAYLGWSVEACLAVQVVASLIEIGLWRAGMRILYPLIFLVGGVDVLTSAYGIQQWVGLPGLPWAVVATVTAMVIALASEPMLTIIARWFLVLRHKKG